MTPTCYALAPSTRGEPTGPDLRVLFVGADDQTSMDCLARIERAQAEYGDFRERGQDWLCEMYQELLDAYVYACADLARLRGRVGGLRDLHLAEATAEHLHDRCDAIRRRMERRDGR